MAAPSIRRTLLLRCGLSVGVLLCLLSVGVYLLVKHSLYREVDDSISQTAALLGNQVELENDEINYEWREGLGTNKALIQDGFFQFWDEKSGATSRSPGLHSLDLPRFSGPGGQPKLRSIVRPDGRRARAIGLRVYPFVLPEEFAKMRERGRVIDPKSMPQILVVARDSEPVHYTLERLRWILAGGTFLAILLGFVVINGVIRVSLRPIKVISRQMKDRAEHQLDSALEIPGRLPLELAGLTRSFDSLLERVAAIRQRERDFIRHAAHELRTPIAGLRATTDLALSQSRDATAYAEYLKTCQRTAIELGELVKRLSALSRMSQTLPVTVGEPYDIRELLDACLTTFQPLVQEQELMMRIEIPHGPLVTTADSTLIRIILNNLLDNAMSYAPSGGEIRFQAGMQDGLVEVRVSNAANDLPEKLERLFEPLFRREKSRTDAGTHLGIGLTLSLEAATAMGATLKACRTEAGWIEFLLRLPPPQNDQT